MFAGPERACPGVGNWIKGAAAGRWVCLCQANEGWVRKGPWMIMPSSEGGPGQPGLWSKLRDAWREGRRALQLAVSIDIIISKAAMCEYTYIADSELVIWGAVDVA